MSKKSSWSIIFLIAVVATVVGYYFYATANLQTQTVAPIVTTHHDKTYQVSSTTKPVAAAPINVPIVFLKSLQSYSDVSPLSFTDSNTGTAVSFRGFVQKATNPGSKVYVGTKNVGQVEGEGIVQSSFSPNNTYFSFTETAVCGATCQDFNIYLLDLNSASLSEIKLPPITSSYSGPADHPGYESFPYIDSYSWSSDNSSLDVTAYVVAYEADTNKYYRVSSVQIWRYDLATQKYILIQTLPE